MELDATRGVSPVVGVLLMMAITVTLAATVGAFATDLVTDRTVDVPQASVTFDFEDAPPGTADALVVTHEGGGSVDPTALRLVVDGATASDGADPPCPVTTRASNRWSAHGMGTTGDVTAGDSATVTNGLFETGGGAVLPADACDADGAPDVVDLEAATAASRSSSRRGAGRTPEPRRSTRPDVSHHLPA
jgi:flagellin-like protein